MFDPQIIPVNGLTGELFLKTVTVVDPADANGIGLVKIASLKSVMVLDGGFIILKTNKKNIGVFLSHRLSAACHPRRADLFKY